jgi:TolA-binding protein
MADVEVFDLVKYANENQPIDFAASLDKLLSQRAVDAIAAKKQEVAQRMFNGPADETEDDEEYDEDELQQALDDMDIDVEELDAEEVELEDEDTEEQEDGESDD